MIVGSIIFYLLEDYFKFIYIYIQYFGLPLKIPCGLSLGQFLWEHPQKLPPKSSSCGNSRNVHHMLIHTGKIMSLSLAYANHCYLAFRFTEWPSNKAWKWTFFGYYLFHINCIKVIKEIKSSFFSGEISTIN